jgi:hypothetical protein
MTIAQYIDNINQRYIPRLSGICNAARNIAEFAILHKRDHVTENIEMSIKIIANYLLFKAALQPNEVSSAQLNAAKRGFYRKAN